VACSQLFEWSMTMTSFWISIPKVNHNELMTIKHGLQPFFFNWHESDGQNSVTAIVQSRPLKTQTLWQRQTFGFVNGIESDVSQNVTQTFSTLISLAMALIITPSLSLTNFCKSDNFGIFKSYALFRPNISKIDTDFIILDENPVYANQISEFIQSV
jgi:hypothetical protein